MREPVEIGCDESGAEGEKLVGGNTDVFAHASVVMDLDSAAACMSELRARAPSPVTEYKANHILREKHRAALRWLLGPDGPVLGHVRVHLTDKTFLVAGKVADLLAPDDTPAAAPSDAPASHPDGAPASHPNGAPASHPNGGPASHPGEAPGLFPCTSSRALATVLYREGPAAFGPKRWTAFLDSFNYLLRAKNGQGIDMSVEDAFRLVGELRTADGPAGEVMELLWRARPRVAAFRERLLAGPDVFPALDPLIPAIVRAVTSWGGAAEGGPGRPVSVVHDRQTTLTDERIARLRAALGPALAGLRLVESRLDARVQVADVMAGVARKVASDELNGRGDARLTALLRPYVDAYSIWGDERSRALLMPPLPGEVMYR
ncbi:hypothetical protein [Nonomuraea jiangxiensis]|uniref:DUF3800 domain-containing protein n=1 Tax=Nonomuraea jiangxiensis TaxID=633440 RepID=A0A1G9ASE5_9ACTN|nr:hypothetical protein [Nonomuraea jiangxiensis]SDK29754.1 hypothetical protein SAMN05421869_11529 [Nonomuraea jiangxiensis]